MSVIDLIAIERKRQIEEENFSINNDVGYNQNEQLALAAICYAAPIDYRGMPSVVLRLWPWAREC